MHAPTNINDYGLAVLWQKPAEIRPNPRNSRTHSNKQIQKIAASIAEFGFNNPILVDAGNQVLAGHGRLEAASQLGLNKVPTIRIDPDRVCKWKSTDGCCATGTHKDRDGEQNSWEKFHVKNPD